MGTQNQANDFSGPLELPRILDTD